nr:50S ribosomal protein L13, chloroplastic [Ipomoea batatas]GME09115.1 50S ribosomal protein L13, chloroplastic [Ipomoea batatas]
MAALQCFTASSAKPFPSTPKKPPFLGFSLPSSKPSLQLVRTNWTTHIRCQAKAATIPAEQQWMFDQTDFKGPDIWNTTWYPKAVDHVNTEKPWYIVDATDKKLGRLASTIAIHIRGKNLVTYTPSVDMGAFVIVLGRHLFNHLKVYKGPEHPHQAQKPADLPIRDKRIEKI